MPLRRSPANPILVPADVPALSPAFTDVSSVFNPGAVRLPDRYVLLVRVQSRGRETCLVTAESADGVHFALAGAPVRFRGLADVGRTIFHVYDPRITPLEGAYYITIAADVDGGCLLGTVRTTDFMEFDFLGFSGEPDIRNGVLFPQRIDGRYARLDRPNTIRLAGGVTSGDEIILSLSDDLVHWDAVAPVMRGRPHFWDERIGPGPPPVRTREGWLVLYHGVATHFASTNIYQAGVALLDLHDPTRVVARGRNNVLEPREPYELMGQVPNVVFPSGWVVEHVDTDGYAAPSSQVKIYYGAADTVIGLATTTVAALLDACRV